jgi:DNA-binding NtrC family response regulator
MSRILLIDDETALLRLMTTYLSRLGYEVEGCSEVHSAEAVLANSSFDLIIADLSLFHGGARLAEIAAAAPDARVLVCSGSPFSVDSLPEQMHSRFAFLQKPFLPNMLASSIEELLAKEI